MQRVLLLRKWRGIAGVPDVAERWLTILHRLSHIQLVEREADVVVHQFEGREVLQALFGFGDFQFLFDDRDQARAEKDAVSGPIFQLSLVKLISDIGPFELGLVCQRQHISLRRDRRNRVEELDDTLALGGRLGEEAIEDGVVVVMLDQAKRTPLVDHRHPFALKPLPLVEPVALCTLLKLTVLLQFDQLAGAAIL